MAKVRRRSEETLTGVPATSALALAEGDERIKARTSSRGAVVRRL